MWHLLLDLSSVEFLIFRLEYQRALVRECTSKLQANQESLASFSKTLCLLQRLTATRKGNKVRHGMAKVLIYMLLQKSYTLS